MDSLGISFDRGAIQDADEQLITTIVEYVIKLGKPVTASAINKKFIHEETNSRTASLLRQSAEAGLLSRNRVRKNANFEYASMDFDWDSYTAAYDTAMAERTRARMVRLSNLS